MTELENSNCKKMRSEDTPKRRFEDTSRTMKNDIEIPLIKSVLPPEMLEKIFSHLAPKDLKTVMLICRTWNKAAETPALWSWVKIRSRSQLQLKRLQGAREMAIYDSSNMVPYENRMIRSMCWDGLLQDILQHPGLKKISLRKDLDTKYVLQIFGSRRCRPSHPGFCKNGGD